MNEEKKDIAVSADANAGAASAEEKVECETCGDEILKSDALTHGEGDSTVYFCTDECKNDFLAEN